MGNYRPFLQGPLPVANYTRIIIPGRFWTRPPSTKSTRVASSATPLHDSLIELAIPDAHAHAIKWYLNILNGPEAEPEGRGQATPKTAPPCASRITILNQVPTGHRMSTGSPQSIPIKTHSFLKAKTYTNTSRPFCHTAHTKAHLISCVGGVTTRHRNHIRIVSFRPAPRSHRVPAYSA